MIRIPALAAAAVAALAIATAGTGAAGSKMTTRTFNHPPRPHPRDDPNPPLPATPLELKSMPRHFDWCEKGFCGPSWNQHIPQYCGSCYLHGSLSAYQDRALIEGVHVTLARQTFLNCAPGRNFTNGCNGGEPAEVFAYMKEYGLPDESCLPYNATDNAKWGESNPQCPPEGECLNCMYIRGTQETSCWPVKTFTRYRAKKWGSVKGEAAMMEEIYKRGPITCSISCPDGFTYDYREGVFEDKTNNFDVDHDVEVVGWGEEDGVKFWNVRNSWGKIKVKLTKTWVEPDLSEVKGVSGDHPHFGGSQFGIVDMKHGKESKTEANEPLEFEADAKDQAADGQSSLAKSDIMSPVSLFAIFSLVTVGAAALYIHSHPVLRESITRRVRGDETPLYSPIN